MPQNRVDHFGGLRSPFLDVDADAPSCPPAVADYVRERLRRKAPTAATSLDSALALSHHVAREAGHADVLTLLDMLVKGS